jgi:hypothetical protein
MSPFPSTIANTYIAASRRRWDRKAPFRTWRVERLASNMRLAIILETAATVATPPYRGTPAGRARGSIRAMPIRNLGAISPMKSAVSQPVCRSTQRRHHRFTKWLALFHEVVPPLHVGQFRMIDI